jgi:hypothetical protein
MGARLEISNTKVMIVVGLVAILLTLAFGVAIERP